jgi:gamma-glutamylcyclotransferase (GGCT)/AIG2-like uncharacterized protein YtfP
MNRGVKVVEKKTTRSRRTASRGAGRNRAYLFVYGTLMRGQKSHGLLAQRRNVEFVGLGKIRGELYELHSHGYPGAIPSAQPDRFVSGQLYRLRNPDSILEDLDEFEGCEEGLFRRALVDAWSKGRKVKAWTYFYARPLGQASPLLTGAYRPARTLGSFRNKNFDLGKGHK